MQYTTITQKRYGVNITPDTIKYRIETNILEAGELPRIDIFVYLIIDVNDPSTDSFEHIASLAELQSLQNERDKAILNGDSYYMSPYLEVEYTDLETAVAATPTLTSRINDLILAWIDYSTKFNTNGDITYNLPTAVNSEVELRTNTYLEAKEERIAAEVALETSENAVNVAEVSLNHSQEILALYNAQKEFCTKVVNSQYPTYIDLVISGNGESTAAFNYRTGTGLLEDSMNSFCITTNAAIATWTNTVAANQDVLNNARGEKIAAEITLNKAEQRESETLALVYEICPDFDLSAL